MDYGRGWCGGALSFVVSRGMQRFRSVRREGYLDKKRKKILYCQEGEQREARWGFDRGSAGWIKICGWDETGRNSVIGWLHLDNRMVEDGGFGGNR